VSENEKNPSTAPGEGPVATDGPHLPADGAAEAPAAKEEFAEDRTAPANGAETHGSAATSEAEPPSAEAAASHGATNGSAAADETAVFARPSPVPHPRPDGPTEAVSPGSVPTPPPWRRANGEANPPSPTARRPAPTTAPVDSLLSEAPTAYIDGEKARSSAGAASFGAARTEVHAEVPSVAGRAPRQALLQVKRFDPWSVLKLALVLAVVLFFIWLVAVGVLYGVLDGMGVWDRLNGTYADLVSGDQGGGSSLISAGSVFGIAAVIGAINSILFAVALTVGAFVYNVSADLVGGIEVTLSERD
jgi:hypothetical protein